MSEHQGADQATKRVVTQQDVADRAGVSRAVVSYVVNNGPRVVLPETQARVLQAIEELGYRPNKYAQGLKLQASEQATGQIGILLGGTVDILHRPYYSLLLAGIYRETHRQNQQIRLVTFIDELKDPVFFNQNIHPEVISGLLLIGSETMVNDPDWPALYERMTNRVANVVSLEHAFADVPAVLFDRVAAAQIAVQHLIDLGHTNIGYAGFPDERYQGYRQKLLEHGLVEPAHFTLDGHVHTPEHGYHTTCALLDLPEPPTALLASADEVALGVLAALRDRGLNSPQDVAIVSIDDLPFASMIRPALTTVHVPKESFGIYALQMLAMREANPDVIPASVVLPVELIVRKSCGTQR
ncbi:LacI family DNA-binding transcriptional regulator [Chloroflexota bacterium]